MNLAPRTVIAAAPSGAFWPESRSARILALFLVLGLLAPLQAQENTLGRSVDSLLEYAKDKNPEYATMRYEAEAADERVTSAGVLPDRNSGPSCVTSRAWASRARRSRPAASAAPNTC